MLLSTSYRLLSSEPRCSRAPRLLETPLKVVSNMLPIRRAVAVIPPHRSSGSHSAAFLKITNLFLKIANLFPKIAHPKIAPRSMRDSAGRFVAEPLRKGGAFCMMHTVLFCRMPMQSCDFVIAYIDLETNSLDPCTGKIVEIGALVDGSRGMFSTVVCPGHDLSPDEDSIHVISHGELFLGHCFEEAFARLDQLLQP